MITMTVIQLITGAIGSVAFGLLFHMKTKYLPLAAAGGFLSWLVFLFGKSLWEVFFFRHCWLVLLQMCMRKSWQESARKLPLLFSLLP